MLPYLHFTLSFLRKQDYLPSPIFMFTKMQIVANMARVLTFLHDKSNGRRSPARKLFKKIVTLIISFL